MSERELAFTFLKHGMGVYYTIQDVVPVLDLIVTSMCIV